MKSSLIQHIGVRQEIQALLISDEESAKNTYQNIQREPEMSNRHQGRDEHSPANQMQKMNSKI